MRDGLRQEPIKQQDVHGTNYYRQPIIDGLPVIRSGKSPRLDYCGPLQVLPNPVVICSVSRSQLSPTN
jgi:hypothetical protein